MLWRWYPESLSYTNHFSLFNGFGLWATKLVQLSREFWECPIFHRMLNQSLQDLRWIPLRIVLRSSRFNFLCSLSITWQKYKTWKSWLLPKISGCQFLFPNHPTMALGRSSSNSSTLRSDAFSLGSPGRCLEKGCWVPGASIYASFWQGSLLKERKVSWRRSTGICGW